MNKFAKYTLIAICLNIVSFILFLTPALLYKGHDTFGPAILGFLLIGISLLIQLVIGLSFLANERKKLVGQAIILSTGIFLLIGFSICSMG